MGVMGTMMVPIRWALGKSLLWADGAFAQKVEVTRTETERAQMKEALKHLSIYQFESCPFCIKVRRALKRMDLEIELRDAKKSSFRDELVKGGGELQVPCLRIAESNGEVRWMYESDDIIDYLEQKFANKTSSSA